MEIGGYETPSPVHDEQPPQEQRVKQEVWYSRDFHEHLTSPHEFIYQELPQALHLDENWHALMEQLVTSTTQQGLEYSVAVSCIDRDGPLLSLPFETDLFFQDQWGERDNPAFISHIREGAEKAAESCPVPSTIEWQGNVVPVRRIGGIHTHPSDVPISDGDMLWLTNPGTRKKFIAVATESFTYFLLRTDVEPTDAHQYVKERENQASWQEWMRYKMRPRQTILERNIQFAQRCKFGLYQGKPSAALTRLA